MKNHELFVFFLLGSYFLAIAMENHPYTVLERRLIDEVNRHQPDLQEVRQLLLRRVDPNTMKDGVSISDLIFNRRLGPKYRHNGVMLQDMASIGFGRVGGTPLINLAVAANNLPLVQLLMEYKASANARAPYNVTPLMIAIKKGFNDIAFFLIDHGADIEIADYINGQTPLMIAAARSNIPVMKKLLKAGADRSTQDFVGKKAADYDQTNTIASFAGEQKFKDVFLKGTKSPGSPVQEIPQDILKYIYELIKQAPYSE